MKFPLLNIDGSKADSIEISDKLVKLKINHKIWDEGSQSSFKDDLDNRGVLLELLSEVDKGKIKNLYVFNTDRLSRTQKSINEEGYYKKDRDTGRVVVK